MRVSSALDAQIPSLQEDATNDSDNDNDNSDFGSADSNSADNENINSSSSRSWSASVSLECCADTPRSVHDEPYILYAVSSAHDSVVEHIGCAPDGMRLSELTTLRLMEQTGEGGDNTPLSSVQVQVAAPLDAGGLVDNIQVLCAMMTGSWFDFISHSSILVSCCPLGRLSSRGLCGGAGRPLFVLEQRRAP